MIIRELLERQCKLCRHWFSQFPGRGRPHEYCGPCKRERYDTRAGRLRKVVDKAGQRAATR